MMKQALKIGEGVRSMNMNSHRAIIGRTAAMFPVPNAVNIKVALFNADNIGGSGVNADGGANSVATGANTTTWNLDL